MPKCKFCGSGITKGKGKMFVENTGQIMMFCSSKCQKNWRLGRTPKKLKWTSPQKEKKK